VPSGEVGFNSHLPQMSTKAKMIPIDGYPGLYTFTDIERDPIAEKKLIEDIEAMAKTLKIKRLFQGPLA
jgi:hypothetical protein